MRAWVERAARVARKPPRVVARRLAHEALVELERTAGARRTRALDARRLLAETEAQNLDELWERLGSRPYAAHVAPIDADELDAVSPGERERVLAAAADAVVRRVDVLGTGPVELGAPVRWHLDPKTGTTWPLAFGPRLDVAQIGRPSDVKVPWEISRLHWLLPCGQAYLLTREERCAAEARAVLEDWLDANPYGLGVNWSLSMEAALRLLSWTWLFHVFRGSEAWRDESFRERFLIGVFLHGLFVERHLELSDVNGNHATAGAAGLVFAGLFFGVGRRPRRWQELGWGLLEAELPRQVHPDGVDFEASASYHRLVFELFLLPALYRRALGLDVGDVYRGRLVAMARFVAAYSRPDGAAPLWGDADDARALPLGGQALLDHRYLVGLVGAAWSVRELLASATGPRSEAFWLLGPEAAAALPAGRPPASTAFFRGGAFVLRRGDDHVFVDCGPVGLRGRGGHGHNDCLSFEAVVDGTPLVTDCGSFVYTSSVDWRNRFRSTAAHNTPRIDGREQNRLVRPESLWALRNDAVPELVRWQLDDEVDLFRGSHRGYGRLAEPVTPVRTIALDKTSHRVVVSDEFRGEGEHDVRVPFHLAQGVAVEERERGLLRLRARGRAFVLAWSDPRDWEAEEREAWVSPRYGVKHEIVCAELRRAGPLRPLLVVLAPADDRADDVVAAAERLLRQRGP